MFQANADGNEVNRVFDPAHLNDAILKTTGQRVDLVGGWRDAGDTLKFSRTTAFAVANLELAARLDPADAPLLRETADVGIRWLLKAHPSDDTFVVLVGDDRDHNTDWRDPADDDGDTRQGVGIRYAYPTVSSDELGIVAGALGLAAAGRSGQQRGALIAAAREWYERAKATNAIVEIQDPNVSDYYPDDGFTDNLAFAATGPVPGDRGPGLPRRGGRATCEPGSDNEFYSGFTAGTVGPLAAADLCGGLGAPAVPNDAARRAGCDGLGKLVSAARERMAATAWGTPGIFMFGWVQDNAGAGALAAAAQRAGVVREGQRHSGRCARLPARPQSVGRQLHRRPRPGRGSQPAPPGLPQGEARQAAGRRGRGRRDHARADAGLRPEARQEPLPPLQLEHARLRGPPRELRDLRGRPCVLRSGGACWPPR